MNVKVLSKLIVNIFQGIKCTIKVKKLLVLLKVFTVNRGHGVQETIMLIFYQKRMSYRIFRASDLMHLSITFSSMCGGRDLLLAFFGGLGPPFLMAFEDLGHNLYFRRLWGTSWGLFWGVLDDLRTRMPK